MGRCGGGRGGGRGGWKRYQHQRIAGRLGIFGRRWLYPAASVEPCYQLPHQHGVVCPVAPPLEEQIRPRRACLDDKAPCLLSRDV